MTIQEFEKVLAYCTNEKKNDILFIKNMAVTVAENRNPQYICDFAEIVSLADTKEIMQILENAMLNYADPNHIYEMAFCMARAKKQFFDLEKFENAIIESNNPKLMYYFMCNVANANIEKLTKPFLNSANAKWFKEYYNNNKIKKFNKTDELVGKYKYLVANKTLPKYLEKYNTNNLISVMTKNILNTNSAYLMTEMAENVANADKALLFKKVLDTKDYLNILEFGRSVSEIDTDIIIDVIKECKQPKIMWYAAEFTKWPIGRKMEKAIKLCENKKYISEIENTIRQKLSCF